MIKEKYQHMVTHAECIAALTMCSMIIHEQLTLWKFLATLSFVAKLLNDLNLSYPAL